MELDSLYQEVILDHYKHPLNKGLSETYGAQVHHVNPSCGDEITLNISAKDGVISSITWDGVGCSISQASVSIASDLLVNKSFKEADSILNNYDFYELKLYLFEEFWLTYQSKITIQSGFSNLNIPATK